MRILTWNCNGALRKKLDTIKSFNADIVIIQECENPEIKSYKEYQKWAGNNYFWIGENKHKGLGIFASRDIHLERLNWDSGDLRYFIPVRVNDEFNFIALWCHIDKIKKYHYIGQLWNYLKLHKEKIGTAIIAGDFNSNVFWDKKNRYWNHTSVVNQLKEIGIESLYHNYFNEKQGSETQPTFYLTKKKEKPYHLDYIFTSKVLSRDLKRFEVGKAKTWMEYSDHMPVFCELGLYLLKTKLIKK